MSDYDSKHENISDENTEKFLENILKDFQENDLLNDGCSCIWIILLLCCGGIYRTAYKDGYKDGCNDPCCHFHCHHKKDD